MVLLIFGEIFKTEVRELARYLKISDKIINKAPTAELYHGQTDEEELGLGYDEIDKILKLNIDGNSMLNIIEKGFDKGKVEKILFLIEKNKHKLEMPSIVKVH